MVNCPLPPTSWKDTRKLLYFEMGHLVPYLFAFLKLPAKWDHKTLCEMYVALQWKLKRPKVSGIWWETICRYFSSAMQDFSRLSSIHKREILKPIWKTRTWHGISYHFAMSQHWWFSIYTATSEHPHRTVKWTVLAFTHLNWSIRREITFMFDSIGESIRSYAIWPHRKRFNCLDSILTISYKICTKTLLNRIIHPGRLLFKFWLLKRPSASPSIHSIPQR